MSLWIPITIAAAFLQNLRSALQKHLKGVMGTTGATFVRFGFGAPFALVFVALLHFWAGYAFPPVGREFLVHAAIGGLAQIAGTFLLVYLFSFRNFVVGTAYSKTEPLQAAGFGFLILGEAVSPATLAAIIVGIFGVLLISLARTSLTRGSMLSAVASRPALIGIASGAAFGISAVAYRGASLSLGGPNFVMQAAVTLAFVTVFQTAVMLVWMAAREPGELARIASAWRPSLLVGMAGITASAGWFTAMTIEKVAYVRALGQIELVFTFAASVFVFRETVTRLEIAGTLLIIAGIVALLYFR
ncbi:MAG TPA: DMT family transporter [Rhizobiaceae bacterium]|nr:DMT family transporter [Rhizobiaceae bacterium]